MDPRHLLNGATGFGYYPYVGKWVRIDRRYNNPYRLTRYAKRVITTWVVVVIVVIILTGTTHGWFAIPAGVALVGYAWYRVRARRQALSAGRPAMQPAAQFGVPPLRFNPPPGWPVPQVGWAPPPGWRPDLSWPQPPPGWRFWVPEVQAPVGERNTRFIPQDVKIAVAARDGGRCRQCGSSTDLHFDHVIPWSKGGANTVANVQLLCGPCNQRKGADDIPVGLLPRRRGPSSGLSRHLAMQRSRMSRTSRMAKQPREKTAELLGANVRDSREHASIAQLELARRTKSS